MSLPKEFLRRVQLQTKDCYDYYRDDGSDDSPWDAWFHRFSEGTNNSHPKTEAMAIVEMEDGEVRVVPMCRYSMRFLDRTP